MYNNASMNTFMQRFANRRPTKNGYPEPMSNGDANYANGNSPGWTSRSNGTSRNGSMPDNGVNASPNYAMGGLSTHGYPAGSSMMMSPSASNGGTSGFFGGGMSVISFKCPECGIVKHSCDDLEIHIKTEHVNWLPFHCPHCTACRASDTQMREHVHSHHRKNDHKYFYVDNPPAKQMLQTLMDRALLAASQVVSKRSAMSNGTSGQANGTDRPYKRLRYDQNALQRRSSNELVAPDGQILDGSETSDDRPRVGVTATIVPKTLNSTEDVLAQIQGLRAPNANDGEMRPTETLNSITEGTTTGDGIETGDSLFPDAMDTVDDETTAQLSNFFGNNSNVKSEFDVSAENLLMRQLEESFAGENSQDVLQNVASLFAARNDDEASSDDVHHQRRRPVRGGRNMLSVSKKRVLGECSRCHKPVTAGARQMHMFFHLGKDHNTYRFRCKHPGCDVEHYRKDQMENHQQKIHGRIEPEMMEDRSLELYNVTQKLSMDLLGTTSNTPGPTAAKAQVAYDNLQRQAAVAALKKRRRIKPHRPDMVASGSGGPMVPHLISDFDNVDLENLEDGTMSVLRREKAEPKPRNNEENLECHLCHKWIMNRIRGFHILWHLSNDLGIIRYNCRFCDFKHERPQSVSTHGKKEHGNEDCVEDSLYKYEDEVKSMSKACFNIEQLFAKEVRRRSKMERAEKAFNEPQSIEGFELDEDSNHTDDTDSKDHSSPSPTDQKKKEELLTPISQSASSSSVMNASKNRASAGSALGTSSSSRRKSTRRFGTRRPKSRKQKEEMAKLREISMRLGGAQYFKKKSTEAVNCERCGKFVTSRLSHHAYAHLEAPLFLCPAPHCTLGHYSRDLMVRHVKDLHNSNDPPMDNRLKFAHDIKNMIQECYPSCFVDAPVPTQSDIEKLKSSLNLDEKALAGFEEETHEDEENEDQDDNEHDDNEENDTEGHETTVDGVEVEEEEEEEANETAEDNDNEVAHENDEDYTEEDEESSSQ